MNCVRCNAPDAAHVAGDYYACPGGCPPGAPCSHDDPAFQPGHAKWCAVCNRDEEIARLTADRDTLDAACVAWAHRVADMKAEIARLTAERGASRQVCAMLVAWDDQDAAGDRMFPGLPADTLTTARRLRAVVDAARAALAGAP